MNSVSHMPCPHVIPMLHVHVLHVHVCMPYLLMSMCVVCYAHVCRVLCHMLHLMPMEWFINII